jgi:hypothetical protein
MAQFRRAAALVLMTISFQSACVAPPSADVPTMIRARWAGTGHEERAVRVARCESKFNPTAQNRRSSAYGVFQFLNSTWKGTGIAKTSDPSLQIEAAYRLWKARGWQPWVCRG